MQMGPQVSQEIVNVCNHMVEQDLSDIYMKLAEAKRVYDVKLKQELCYDKFEFCEDRSRKSQRRKSRDEYEDVEDIEL